LKAFTTAKVATSGYLRATEQAQIRLCSDNLLFQQTLSLEIAFPSLDRTMLALIAPIFMQALWRTPAKSQYLTAYLAATVT
jgi:hypothetical protein